MKAGGGKQKGAEFERSVCVALSLWVTAGKRKDVFWRSAMSGGRATVSKGTVRQGGDMCSVAPEGHSFTDRFFVEHKHVKDLNFGSFLLKECGELHRFWHICKRESVKYQKAPMLIARQNLWPTFVVTQRDGLLTHFLLSALRYLPPVVKSYSQDVDIYLFEELLKIKYEPMGLS